MNENKIVKIEEKEERKDLLSEVKKEEKHKSQVRLFFLFLILSLALLGYLIYEIIMIFTNI